LNNAWFLFGALIINDIVILYTLLLLWRKRFYLHIISCDTCDSPVLVHAHIDETDECENCHVCEHCGKYLTCSTCGKKRLVRKDVEKILWCDSIGCLEKYKLNKEKEVTE
jgi:hypothetical protein